MNEVKKIVDKLGNTILVDSKWYINLDIGFEDFQRLFTHPSYIIRRRKNGLAFINHLKFGVNILAETTNKEGAYEIYKCIINPTKQYIIHLLKNGELISY